MRISRRDVLLGSTAAISSLAATSFLIGAARSGAAEWTLPERKPFRVIENTWITMKDGTRLAAKLWIPESAEHEPVPVVFEYLPYRLRDRMRARDNATAANLAPYGLAFARVDIRGSGDSEGVIVDEYDVPEMNDGLEIIAWLAKQSWSNGLVGMRGISWGGINTLQIAALAPPALKAIMPMGFANHRFNDDAHWTGGCLMRANYLWGRLFQLVMAKPPDPVIVGPQWEKMWQQRLDATPAILETWTSHQRFDAYWQRNSVSLEYGRIKCPTYAVSGWQDHYSDCVGTLLANLKVPRKGLIGPWGHSMPNLPIPLALDWRYEEVRWWHHWLKGINTGIMDEPMLRIYMPYRTPSGDPDAEIPGRWVAEGTWPSPRTETRVTYLQAGGHLASAPGPQSNVKYVADKFVVFGRSEQASADRKSMCFDSAPVDADLEILGYPKAKIRVSADVPVAKFVIRLNELLPNGESWMVTYGVLNLPHRNSLEHPVALKPGEFYDVEVPLLMTAHRFKKGSRIRAAISESLWPFVWPSPTVATLNITLGVSSLILPVRPALAAEAPFTIPVIHHAPEPAQGPYAGPLVGASHEEQKTSALPEPDAHDKITVGKDIPAVGRASPPQEDTGIIMTDGVSDYGEIVEGAPNSCVWRSESIYGLKCDEWDCTIINGYELTSTASELHLKEYVRAKKADTQFFAREKRSVIKRELI